MSKLLGGRHNQVRTPVEHPDRGSNPGLSSTLGVLQLLPVKSLASKLVVKRSGLSLEKFLKDHYLSGTPVIISDCMAHWPAKKNWNNIDYLLRVAGDRTVPVEIAG
ncbi:lysine-specific demethylase 8-like protein [Trifolium pratense]|uniref:Lysine-specific demethylase 8-like protein n=1 Tax=Trifolium pratense TaxID=57577 RepID=A0A2K3LFM5_TRIPR|nr:lysine-specific demethylase 8-like protein [Trifolium pratense]